MSNVCGHNPLGFAHEPKGGVPDAQRTIAFLDARRLLAAFEEAFPESTPFYEIVCQLPGIGERQLFLETVNAIQNLGLDVHWFLVPRADAAPEVESNTEAAIRYYREAFELAEQAGIGYLSTLPASWRGNRNAKKLVGKARYSFYHQIANVLATALEQSGAVGFKLGLEPLSGKNRRTRKRGPALELSFPNTPDEVQPLCDRINDIAGRRVAFSVVDWAHLFYGLSSWAEAKARVVMLIHHLEARNVSRMHLSIPETRGSATPPAGSPWAKFTKQRLDWIRRGMEMLLNEGFNLPPTSAEAFIPSDFAGFGFILPDTGFDRENREQHFVALFSAVVPEPSAVPA